MATYSAITSGQIDAESPLDVTLAGQWTNNLLAVIEGDATAPRIDEKAHKQYKMCVYTSSGKHYMKANKRSLIVAVGGGGSGAGRDTDAAASCSGGGSGSLAWKDTTPTSDETLTLTVGAGGAAVTTNNNNGNDGSDTTVVGTTVNMTAGAGKGGVQSSVTTTTASAAPNASSGYDGLITGGRSGAVTGGSGTLATGGGSLNYDSSTITGGTDVIGAGGNPQSTVTLTATETDVEQYYIGEIDSTFSSMFLALIGNTTFADNKDRLSPNELHLSEILTTGMTLPSPSGSLSAASGLGAGGGAYSNNAGVSGEGGDGSFGGGGGAACYNSSTTGQGGRGGNGVVIVMQEI